MSEENKDDLSVGEVYINSSSLNETQIKALDQLLQFQCFRLEKKLKALQMKRRYLSEGKDVHVSLCDLISREIIEAAEYLSNSSEPSLSLDKGDCDLSKVKDTPVTKSQDEITRIIDTINSREPSESKHVQFAESEEDDSQNTSNESGDGKEDFYCRKNKRSSTLPNPNEKMNLSGEVQLILHNKGTCKPCAFVYNKKKTCRNGPTCGFCHHEDHALCTVKRWKKQQKLVSSGSFMAETITQLRRTNSEVG